MTFKLMGQLPSGKNRIIVTRSGHRFPDPKSRFPKWRDEAMKQIFTQIADKPMVVHKCKLVVDYVPGDARVRDCAGMIDALCHVMEKAKVIENDGLIRDVEWHEFPIDREHPMAVVTVKRL
jgi:hypothetical protein